MSDATPLAAVAANAGAVFIDEAGWQLPAHFGDADAEYREARSHAAVIDVSHHAKVAVTGKDAARFLHNLCTNDLLALPPGLGREAFLTTGQAKIVAHAWFFRLQEPDGTETWWLDAGPFNSEGTFRHLNHYHVCEDVTLADRTRDLAQLHLVGPKSAQIVRKTLGDEAASLSDLEHCKGKLDPWLNVQVRRRDWLGPPGFDLICPPKEAEVLWNAMTEAGATPAGLQALHILRIEAGTPYFGIDIDDTNLPQEVGRTDRAVSFTKGCYIGQETVARIRTYGHVNRELVGLQLDNAKPISRGAKLYRQDQEVGQITSSALSPRIGSVIALACVRRGHKEPGTELEIRTTEGTRTAKVAALPFA